MPTLQQRNRRRGKAAERGVADYLGWQRIGTMSREDLRSLDDTFSGECKSVARTVVERWMKQAEANAAKRGKSRKRGVPLVAIHTRGMNVENDIICLRAKFFKRLLAGEPLLKEG